ncbi:WD40 repeat-like protein [Trichodelitschia bisporula]|uniref:WD40 repeat-like protein n=1 Tax=Trichodelitschia bisporula TaxID=703511 RepID=A0A6G1HMX1_9PEZI|nr:WD40 repeat-like protein [Trichodelitschia bisporula]
MDFTPTFPAEDYDEDDPEEEWDDEGMEDEEYQLEDDGMDEEEEEDEEDMEYDDEDDEADEDDQAGHPQLVTPDQILRLFGSENGLRQMMRSYSGAFFASTPEEAAEKRPREGRKKYWPPIQFEKVPSANGRDLMFTGTFGTTERGTNSVTPTRQKKLAYRLLRRELGLGPYGRQRAENSTLRQGLLPSSKADSIIHYGSRCYSGQFSNDGNFFFTCGQDFKVRMYDTSNPYKWEYYKSVDFDSGSWTITDASLSPDNRFLAYSSITKMVCLASTDSADDSPPRHLDFANLAADSHAGWRPRGHYSRFGVWSIRFSGDGRELVAGTVDRSVYVYDIERGQSVLRIQGHDDDVNAVCFADTASPHILYSGSDDTTLKVWDRRSMGDGRPAGVFLGHTEGLTYVDSKGDGRYILSNGKDQCAKLWDLRKAMTPERVDRIPINSYSTGFEYRMNSYNFENWRPHPHDSSLVTFRGHEVLMTLIRCHFSPQGSSDSRYVYSGSYDGKVYIWNMDATLAGQIDVSAATQHMSRRQGPGFQARHFFSGPQNFRVCVRDASWHPNAPIIAATAWNGRGSSLGTCTVHSWSDGLEDDEGEPPMGYQLDAELRPETGHN